MSVRAFTGTRACLAIVPVRAYPHPGGNGCGGPGAGHPARGARGQLRPALRHRRLRAPHWADGARGQVGAGDGLFQREGRQPGQAAGGADAGGQPGGAQLAAAVRHQGQLRRGGPLQEVRRKQVSATGNRRRESTPARKGGMRVGARTRWL